MGPIPNVRERGCLVGTGPILTEIEFSRVGSRAYVALGDSNSGHHASDEEALAAMTFVRRGTIARTEVTFAAALAARRGTIARTEVTFAAHDTVSSFSACEPSHDA